MAYPIYEDNGGIGTGTGFSCSLNYPSTVNADDILIAVVMDTDDDTFDTPAGWTKLSENGSNTNLSYAWYWKRADGTETGSVTFTSALNAGQLVAGIIYRYSGCIKYGDPYHDENETSISQATDKGLGFGGSRFPDNEDELCVEFIIVEDNTINGFSGTDWTEDSRLSTATGSDAHFAAASYQGVKLTNPPPPNWTFSGNEYCLAFALFLIPEGDVPVTLNTPADAADIGDDTTPTVEFTPNSAEEAVVDEQLTGSGLRRGTDNINDESGQSFTGNGEDINYVEFDIFQGTSVTGGVWEARIYAHSGTYGTSSLPTGGALATSNPINGANMAINGWQRFVFPTPFTTVNSTKYVVVIRCTTAPSAGDLDVDGSNSSVHDGNVAWLGTAYSDHDFKFSIGYAQYNEVEIEIDTVNTFDSGITHIDSYSESNQDGGENIVGTTERVGQSFTGDGEDINRVTLQLINTGSPVGRILVSIWTHSGTFGTSSVPNLLHSKEHAYIDASTTTGSLALYDFDFTIPIPTVNGTKYVLVISHPSSFSGNFVSVRYDGSSTSHGGNYSSFNGTTWTANSARDLCFYVSTRNPLIKALSSIPDAEFLNTVNGGDTHPFNDNEKLSYEVQINDLIDSYGVEHNSNGVILYSGGDEAVGQSFTGTGKELLSASFVISKFGSPTGNIVAKLYAHTGTFGSSSVPTGSALATSDTVDISTISDTVGNIEPFDFSTPYTPVNGTKYVIVVEYSGGDASNRLNVRLDGSGTHEGNASFFDSGWTSQSDELLFYLYEEPYGLPYGTVYWRARAINPTGINVWDEWSAIRSFDVTAADGAISATVDGASTVTVSIGAKGKISATVDGNSVVTVNVIIQPSIEFILATIDGASTTTANIEAKGLISSTVDGNSIVIVDIKAKGEISATVDSNSDVTINIGAKGLISSTVDGGSVVTVSITSAPTPFSATIDGASTVTANIEAVGRISVTINSGSTTTANILADAEISTTINGASAVTVDISAIGRVSATINAGSTVTVNAQDGGDNNFISSTINTASIVTVNILAVGNLSATINGNSITSADIRAKGLLQATISGVSAVSCNIINGADSNISATINGSSNVIVSIKAKGLLQATIGGGSTVICDLINGADSTISATINGSSTVTANITAKGLVSATVGGSSTVTVNAQDGGDNNFISATINGTSSVLVQIEAKGEISSTINTSSTVITDISAVGKVSTTINAGSTLIVSIEAKGLMASTFSSTSTVLVQLGGKGYISATVNPGSTVTCNLVAQDDNTISATINASSTVTISIEAIGLISTTINAGSTISVNVQDGGDNNAISATINGVSTVTISLAAKGLISSVVNTASTVSADILGKGYISSTIGGGSTITCSIINATASSNISASINTSSSVIVSVEAKGFISATIGGNSSVSCKLIDPGAVVIKLKKYYTVRYRRNI